MALTVYKQIGTDDPVLGKIQQNSSDVFNDISKRKIVDGLLLQDITLVATKANLVPHYLGRNPFGYAIVKKSPVSSGFVTDLGTEKLWPFTSPPLGWLIANGAAISRVTYSDLFNLIGTMYGVGDGSTTFNLPDCRGRAPVGKTAAGTGSTLGGVFGSLDFTVSVPAHFHGMGPGATLNITASGAHGHKVPADQFKWNAAASGATWKAVDGENIGTTPVTDRNTSNTDTHTHPAGNFSGAIGNVSGGSDGNSSMTSGVANAPSFVRNWIIKAQKNAALSSFDVWDSDLDEDLSRLYLNLYTSIDVKISLWVF